MGSHARGVMTITAHREVEHQRSVRSIRGNMLIKIKLLTLADVDVRAA